MSGSDISKSSKSSDQPDKFREAARELGCDEDEARFEETLRNAAKTAKAERI